MLKKFASTLIIIGLTFVFERADAIQISTLTPDSRIIGGYQSNIIRVPYYVYIRLKEDNIKRSCGGSIISRTWVLTAAHCLFRQLRRIPNDGIIIDAGVSTLDIPKDYEQMRHVIFSVVYETWTNPIREHIVNHDIALLQTCTSWEYTSWVQPIALAPRDYVLPDGINALACGFGDTESYGPVHGSRELYAVVLRKRPCWVRRPASTILCFEGITSTISGICHGDSGGPLMYLHNQTPVLIGVASGTGCKVNVGGGSFTDVSLYRDWIREKTGI